MARVGPWICWQIAQQFDGRHDDPVRSDRHAGQAGVLTDEQRGGDADEIAGQDRLRQEIGDDPEAERRSGKAEDADDQGQHRRDLRPLLDRRQAQLGQRRLDQNAGRGVRANQDARRPEHGVGGHRQDRGIETGLWGQADDGGIGQADRHGHGGHG